MIGLRRKNGVTQAILALASNVAFTVRDESYDQIEWFSPNIPMPSREAVEAKMVELEANEPMRCLREIRDWYLQQCDWTQGYDIRQLRGPEWCAAWDEYRQRLRDLPTTATPYFIDDMDPAIHGVEWPAKPSR